MVDYYINSKSEYFKNIKNRNLFQFIKGLIPRYINWRKHEKARNIARKRGAKIGNFSIIPLSLAKRANNNLIIGDHSSIQTDKIDLRSPVKIGSYSIIGNNCDIITTSHQLDSVEWEHKYYGIEIEDYVWISTKVLILPSCRKIEFGATIAAGSVVVKNISPMSVVGGNPAVHIKSRKVIHKNLVVESLLGGDLIAYWSSYFNKNL